MCRSPPRSARPLPAYRREPKWLMLRLTGMRSLVVLTLAVSACSSSSGASDRPAAVQNPSATAAAYPQEFRGACGHPGAKVQVQAQHLVVRHTDCDLTGVYLLNRSGSAGTVVPEPGEGSANSLGVTVEVTKATQDVTFTQETGSGHGIPPVPTATG